MDLAHELDTNTRYNPLGCAKKVVVFYVTNIIVIGTMILLTNTNNSKDFICLVKKSKRSAKNNFISILKTIKTESTYILYQVSVSKI